MRLGVLKELKVRILKVTLAHILCASRGFSLLLCSVLSTLSLMVFVWCLMAWEYISVWPVFLSLGGAIGFAALYRYYDMLVFRLRPKSMRLTL